MLRFRTARWLALLGPLVACRPQPTGTPVAQFEPQGPNCEPRKAELVAFTASLPAETLGPPEIHLPESTLGGVPGSGPVLELTAAGATFDGERAEPPVVAERLSAAGATTLFIAAARDVDIQTLRAYLAPLPKAVRPKLLFRTLPPSAEDGDFSARLLAERDPERRHTLALEAFATFSKCSALHDAAASVKGLPPRRRWSALRDAVLGALPQCGCDELDTARLRQLLAAEQRAGSMSLGVLPIDFLRDARCGASMPLRSLQKLLGQIEAFEEEYSGAYKEGALEFDKVVTEERLLNYFCDALPGETLAALQRSRATLYWRVPGDVTCHAFQFEPLEPGAPMGTWRRVSGGPPLALHYRQFAEDIRLFGPATPTSKPTDQHPWACRQELELVSVDERSIGVEQGRWFFSEGACRGADEASAMPGGCIADLIRPSAQDVPSDSTAE